METDTGKKNLIKENLKVFYLSNAILLTVNLLRQK